jgi:hypothetical protein
MVLHCNGEAELAALTYSAGIHTLVFDVRGKLNELSPAYGIGI